MTTLLAAVLHRVAELPRERQDDAAHILIGMIESDGSLYHLTTEQLQDLDLAIAEADAGEFATDAEMAEVLYEPWA